MRTFNLFCFLLLLSLPLRGQYGHLTGKVIGLDGPLAFANVEIPDIRSSVLTDTTGMFSMKEVPYGTYELVIQYLGYRDFTTTITIDQSMEILKNPIILEEEAHLFDQIVVTGTKTFKRKTESAIIVNVLDHKSLENVQACNLSEGLKFQPGLRVESNCQTCNYSQLRMNGLGGGYSQILINGRPIFSPLTGLYGLEQMPSNMVDRIEVVRGGGSAIYGSSAIGGTVNVITRLPIENSASLSYTYQNIDHGTQEQIVNLNSTLVNDKKNIGISLFANWRDRGFYDANNDQFSELPLLDNKAIGVQSFWLPDDNQKLEWSGSYLNEYRYGGDMLADSPENAAQVEERLHHVWMGSLDYQINFNQDKSSLIAYAAGQYTDRDHITGIRPDGAEELDIYLQNPPFGTSLSTTWQAGIQVNHKIESKSIGQQVWTIGTEYIEDDINDVIAAYNYNIDQKTENLGVFVQNDWQISPKVNLLSGVRWDKHNLMNSSILNPRLSLLYSPTQNFQYRISYAEGFRAPQAFDSDLHIAFAGGGVSRVTLSPTLLPETSQSYSTSINYDKIKENWIAGFTLEGFYTKLDNAFYLQPTGEDVFGETFIKSNGEGSTVSGITLELRANYREKVQVEGGFTWQRSAFDQAVEVIEGLPHVERFLRTPDEYGYAIISLFPSEKWKSTVSAVYTGSMLLSHFAGAPENTQDRLVESREFLEIGWKFDYFIPWRDHQITLSMGIKNIFNAFQSDFDSGKNRDSNYAYGPMFPRTWYLGVQYDL